MTTNTIENTVNSSLWAAYGDALGFISELADRRLLVKRTGEDHVSHLVGWTRQIGGIYGPLVSIPIGGYSDDTQLRVSTSRAINHNNHFDINAFSKVELPVWSSYALGAGLASKIAAESLGKKTVTWYNNFYQSKKVNYILSGGNGAAMRIQPHVWACKTPEKVDSFILDIIKNTLTTHGHPRAVAGAVFHSLCLSHVVTFRQIPSISDARLFLHWINEIPNIILADINLNTAWIPLFESRSSMGLKDVYQDVYNELVHLLDRVEVWLKDKNLTYTSLVKELDLREKSIRGSGTLTTVAALAASYLKLDNLSSLMLDIVNELGTDTDSIATMVGALRGYIEGTRPPQELQDQAYLIYDAERLYAISQGQKVNNFIFPNINEWNVPASSLDFVSIQDGNMILSPFGPIKPISEEFRSNNTETYQYFYQWVKSEFNQSFLVKMRDNPKTQSVAIENEAFDNSILHKGLDSSNPHKQQIEIPIAYRNDSKIKSRDVNIINDKDLDLDFLTSEAIKSNFDEKVIGGHLLKISNNLGVNQAVAYSAIIAKAIISRNKRGG